MSHLIPILGKSSPFGTFDRAALPLLVAVENDDFVNDFIDFFIVTIRNAHTRRAYGRGIRRFCDWCGQVGIAQLRQVDARILSIYIEQHPCSAATIHQEMAALSMFFDWMMEKHHFEQNPCCQVKRPRLAYTEGKTPVLETEEARELLDSIDTSHVIGLRDRAMMGVMFFTFARIGAVVKLQVRDYAPQGKRYFLHLKEKGSKARKIPVHHILEEYLDAYLDAGALLEQPDTPMFRSTRGRSRRLTERAIKEGSALRMVKRRAKDAALQGNFCNHSFRATGITNYLTNQGSRDRAQYIAGHADVRTTALYDRRKEMVSLDEIERIRF